MKFRLKNLQETDHSEYVGVDEITILKGFLEKWVGKLWIGFIWLRIRSQWRALVNTVMNLRVR
jgi:hypothetical protein